MIQQISDFGQLSNEWECLSHEIPNLRIFQTYEWCRSAWTMCLDKQGNSLYVLVWRQENVSDIVIFPFYLDWNGTLRFIMDEHSDYGDCVYVPGRNHHLAYKEALDYIRGDGRVKMVSLHKMDGNSEALNYFAALLPQSFVVKENTYSWIDVVPSDDFATSQQQLRSKDKANVRAIKRKAEKYKLVLHKGGRDDFPLDDIDSLIDSMRKEGRRQRDFMSGELKEFCRRIFESGMSDIVELVDANGKVTALNFILQMRTRRLSWIFLYADPHASTELYVKYFYDETGDTPFVFDFGTGGYDYKLGTFRPCTRALFGLSIALNKKQAIRLELYRLLCSAKKFVKSILRGWK